MKAAGWNCIPAYDPPQQKYENHAELELSNVIKESPQLSHSNHQISRKFLLTGVILFLIVLFLPHEWSQTLDILGARISAVATGIPSVKKAAAISPISELVRGFFGIGILLLPFIYAFIFGKDPIRLRFKYGLDKAESKLKFFGFIYCLGLPAVTVHPAG